MSETTCLYTAFWSILLKWPFHCFMLKMGCAINGSSKSSLKTFVFRTGGRQRIYLAYNFTNCLASRQQAIAWTNAKLLPKMFCGVHLREISQEVLMSLIRDMSSDITPHHGDVIMGAMAYRITSLKIVCTTVYSGADQRQHQSSASLAFVRGIHRTGDRWIPRTNQRSVTRKMSPFDDVIMLRIITASFRDQWVKIRVCVFRCFGTSRYIYPYPSRVLYLSRVKCP